MRRKKDSDITLLIGQAKNIQRSQEQRSTMRSFLLASQHVGSGRESFDVCSFVLEQFDAEGNLTSGVAVEISSSNGFYGLLAEGHHVAIYANRDGSGGSYAAAALRNLTTGGIFGDRKLIQRGKAIVPPSR